MTTKCEQQPQDQQETYTPEEVKRDLDIVAEVLVAYVARSDVSSPSRAALSRLTAQAARVPGLESDALRLAEAAEESEKARIQAESERDAAMGALAAAGFADVTLGARVARVVEHLQRARGEVDRVKQVAVSLDAEKIALQSSVEGKRFLELALKREQAGSATLRERVATLEAERVASDESHRDAERALAAQRDTLEGCLEGAKEREDAAVKRADTAESRVRELEERGASLESDVKAYKSRTQHLESAIQAKADDYRASHGEDTEGPHPLVDWADRVLRGASQPPPAPAQGPTATDLEVAQYVTTEHEKSRDSTCHESRQRHRGRVEGASAALRIMGQTTTPTPPPGLLEAVTQVDVACGMCGGKRVRKTSCSMCHDSTWDHECDDRDVPCHWTGHAVIDAIRAAYDATGGEHPDTAALRDLRADVARVLEMARLGVHVGDTATEVGEKAVQAVRALHEDATKYRAAVERFDAVGLTRAGRVASYILHGHPTPPASLGLASDSQPPTPREMLDKARVVEVLERHLGPHAVRAILRDLGLTLDTPPSGPGGGDIDNLNGESPAVESVRLAAEAGLPVRITTRARIAPTPTPEVPPLKRAMDTRQQEDMARGWAKWNAGGMDGQPEAEGPVVLLERDGVRVSKHPASQPEDFMVSYPQHMSAGRALGTLANEVARLLGLLDVNARALSQAVRHAAELGAEEMRGQVQHLLRSLGGDENITATGKMWLVRAEVDVRALPVLGKAVRRG